MAHIELLSEIKKRINYDLFFDDLSKKYKEYDFFDLNKRLDNLVNLIGKTELDTLEDFNINIFIKSNFVSKDRIENTRFSRRNYRSYLNDNNEDEIIYDNLGKLNIDKNNLIKISKIYHLSNLLNIELSKYILNRYTHLSFQNNFSNFSFDNENINFILDEINNNKYISSLVGGLRFEINEISKSELKKIQNILNKIINKLEEFDLDDFFNNDFNINVNIKLKYVLKFLITKLEEQDFQVNNEEIVDVFEKLEKKADITGNTSLKISKGILITIILLNLLLFGLSIGKIIKFDMNYIFGYIPLIVLEILLFKFMFFFFDRYNSYSKISFLYNYYIGLLKADNIYTTDKKFTAEQNFSLREKTYNELTNLSSHIKGMVDKKGTSQKDSLELFKEINNISPFFKNMNK